MIGICLLGAWGFNPAHADVIHTLDGKTYEGEIRLEGGQSLHIVDHDGRNAAVKLSHLLDATVDNPATTAMSRGVVLTDGTALAGSIDSISDKFIRVTPPGSAAVQLPVENIARVVFQTAGPEVVGKAPAGSSGLLLKGGDFLEATLRNYDGRSVRMESALFGVADFDTQDKAVALVFRPAKSLEGETLIRAVNGSVLAADQLSLDHGQLKFNALGIGPMSLQRKDLADIRTGGGRLVPLTDLHPVKIDGGETARAYLVDATSIGLAPRLIGTELKHAIVITAGSSITYALDGKFDVFTAKAGMPADAVPMTQLRFAVIVDGKEVSTTMRSSTDDPALIGVDVHDAKKLTLTVSSQPTAGADSSGIWGDPQLVRHAVQKFSPATQALGN